ncbi:unnamed protein product [Spirodela intermedia]|uniref:Uncharacterized protein n=1 Tax=Spirodela intermedia TaxID=51605 RepID=A0ABN7EC73_SPIIN|nr:unnamed protein product [Spirodela intermedia]
MKLPDTRPTSIQLLSRIKKWSSNRLPVAVTRRNGKNGDFVALRRLSPDGEELDGGGARVRSFILRSAQQEEALHRIWYALRRWRLVSRRIVLFPTTTCSSINRDDLLDGFAILLSRIVQQF